MKKLEFSEMETLQGGQKQDLKNADDGTGGGSGGCTGDNIAGCIADAYANQGWASVALGLTSAVFPQTVAAITLACMAKNGC